MKILRKSKGQWIAISKAVAVLACGLSLASAPVFQTQMTQASENVVEEIKLTSNFAGKEDLLKNEAVKQYIQETLKQAETNDSEDNSVEAIQAEIKRQEGLMLPAYIVQPGDTLVNLAEAVGKTVKDLAQENGYDHTSVKLQVGDLLTGVLNQEKKETVNSNQKTSRGAIIVTIGDKDVNSKADQTNVDSDNQSSQENSAKNVEISVDVPNNTENQQEITEKDSDITEKDNDNTEVTPEKPEVTEEEPEVTEEKPEVTEEKPEVTEEEPEVTEEEPEVTEEEPEVTEEEPEVTEEEPEVTEEEPEVTEEEPEVTEEEPEVTEEEPEVTEEEPEVTEEEPEVTEEKPEVTEEEPEVTEEEPEVTEEEPEVTEEEPEVTEEEPEVTEEEPEVTEEEPEVTEEEPEVTEEEPEVTEEKPEVTEEKPEVTQEKPEVTEEEPEVTEEEPEVTEDPDKEVEIKTLEDVRRYVNQSVLQNEFLKLVNRERVKEGVEPIMFSNVIYNAMIKDRMNQLENNGSIYFYDHKTGQKIPHVMRDVTLEDIGTNAKNVDLKDLLENSPHFRPYGLFGENLAAIMGGGGDFTYMGVTNKTLNQYLAQKFFTNWMNSEGHRPQLMSSNYKYTAWGVVFSDFTRQDVNTYDPDGRFVGAVLISGWDRLFKNIIEGEEEINGIMMYTVRDYDSNDLLAYRPVDESITDFVSGLDNNQSPTTTDAKEEVTEDVTELTSEETSVEETSVEESAETPVDQSSEEVYTEIEETVADNQTSEFVEDATNETLGLTEDTNSDTFANDPALSLE